MNNALTALRKFPYANRCGGLANCGRGLSGGASGTSRSEASARLTYKQHKLKAMINGMNKRDDEHNESFS